MVVSKAEPVRFEPVQPPKEASAVEVTDEDSEDTGPGGNLAQAEALPLAGPILDEARSKVLRGRCSACDTKLRVSLDGPDVSQVRVRCPICSHARLIEV